MSDSFEYSIKEELISMKKELKCWESMFSRRHGRKPAKEDIKASGEEIRVSYKRYAKLKERLLNGATNLPFTCSPNSPLPNQANIKENNDDIFGIKLNKNQNDNSSRVKSHLKDQSLVDKHKTSYAKKRHIKISLSKERISYHPNVPENDGEDNTVNRVQSKCLTDDEEVTSLENHILLANDVLQRIDITSKLSKESEISRMPKKSREIRWKKNFSKDWLERLKPVDKSKDQELLLPFEHFEEDIDNDLEAISSANAGAQYHDKECKGQSSQQSDVAARQEPSTTTQIGRLSNDDETQVKTNTSVARTSGSCLGIAINSTCGTSLGSNFSAFEGSQSQVNVTANVNDNDHVQQQGNKHRLTFGSKDCRHSFRGSWSEVVDKISRKRKKSDSRDVINDNRNLAVKEGYVANATKKLKRDNTVKPVEKTAGKRKKLESSQHVTEFQNVVSENFVAIDIQRKKYQRGKRRLKGSTYKRQQWKMKSQYSSKKNNEICYFCKGTGHWAEDCSSNLRIKRRLSSFNEKSNEAYKPVHESEDVGKFSSFYIEDVPELPRMWPRMPYETESLMCQVAPLFSAADGKPPPEATKEVNDALKTLGYSSFRHGQENVVSRIVTGLSTLLVSSTGSGKSLCYQLPAYLYYKKAKYLTIVISPLVALMEDQVGNLPLNVKGACLHSGMTKTHREKTIQNVSDRKIAILFLSPEALLAGSSSTGYMVLLRNLPPVAFVCIDEAHCISEWSHNFRPSYLRVCKVLRDLMGLRCFLGLTATSTKATSLSVSKHLGITDRELAIIRGSEVPDNLHITVSKENDRDQALLTMLSGEKFSKCASMIIYCTRRDETERLSSLLRTCLKNLPPTAVDLNENSEVKPNANGRKKCGKPKPKYIAWDADFYHAGMTAAQRRKIQNLFMSGELRIVVATTAFGMGLNKAAVRAIIHYNMPKSFESFVQEIGRAGRDGLPSYCHVFLDKEGKDLCELRRHIYANTVDFKTIKNLLIKVFKTCDCKERSVDSQLARKSATEENKMNSEKKKTEAPSDFILKEDDFAGIADFEIAKVECLDRDAIVAEEIVTESIEISQLDDSCLIKTIGEEQSGLEEPLEPGLIQYEADNCSMNRFCSGHHVAFSVDEAVQDLDMREESIATLLAYLENIPDAYTTLLGTRRSNVTLQCYGGQKQMKMLAMKFLPMTAVFNHIRRNHLKLADSKVITFDVIEIADEMCWDVNVFIRELFSLQWNTSFSVDKPGSLVGKSGITVELNGQYFHVNAPGDLSNDERDHVCSILHDMVNNHEKRQILQLDSLYSILSNSAEGAIHPSLNDVTKQEDCSLRSRIREYFECEPSKMEQFLTSLSPNRIETVVSQSKWDTISRDIRTIVGLHHDVMFNGRAIARVFHGIDSPCFPATTWGRDRRFWRRHMDVDFNELCKFITTELIRYRT